MCLFETKLFRTKKNIVICSGDKKTFPMRRPSLSWFIHTAGPNTALIKTSGRKGVSVVIGGRLFAIPILHRVEKLSLNLQTLIVETIGGLTVNGVKVDVTSACQVKICGWQCPNDHDASKHHDAEDQLLVDESAIRLAAQHFLGRKKEQMLETIKKSISGHQRAIIGYLTVEQLYRDRQAFCERVLDFISSDMRNMGLTVVSYTVIDISDNNGYIEALGVAQTEAVKRAADEGKALHKNAAKIASAIHDRAAHIEANKQTERKIISDKETEVSRAEATAEVEREQAKLQKAFEISDAQQEGVLLARVQKAKEKEAQAELLVAKAEVKREKLIKEKQVHVEADAMLYRARMDAERLCTAAQAQAERMLTIGNAEANVLCKKGMAEAEILRKRNRAWAEVYVSLFHLSNAPLLLYFVNIYCDILYMYLLFVTDT